MLALGILLMATPVPHVSGRTYVASASHVLELANRAAEVGDVAAAEAAYRALFADKSASIRAEARFRLARLIAPLGHEREAAILLRRILDEQPAATLVRIELAQILDRMGDKEAALREIRAVQAAGLPPNVARLVDRYSEALRAARPQGANLEIAIAPDSNISRSTRSDTLETVIGEFEIDDDSKAKSGLGLALRGQAYRRVQVGGDGASLLFRASGFADLYKKSQFNDIALDFAGGPEFFAGRTRVQFEIGATQRWFGQSPQMRSARVKGTWTVAVDRQSQLRMEASASLIDNQVNDLQDGKRYAGEVAYERALSASMGAALTVAADRMASRDAAYSTNGWRAGLLAWRDFGRTTFTVGAELGRLRADDRLSLFPEKRVDRSYRLSFGATLRQLTFGGFAPVTRLVIERNRSTIEFYDYRRVRTELGIVRPF